MSKPIRCLRCGAVVGTTCSIGRVLPRNVGCTGRENHKPTIVTYYKKWFGLFYEKHVEYPETHTVSIYNVFKRKSKLLLWLTVIIFGSMFYENEDRWASR
jgi:hypothetical protein